MRTGNPKGSGRRWVGVGGNGVGGVGWKSEALFWFTPSVPKDPVLKVGDL